MLGLVSLGEPGYDGMCSRHWREKIPKKPYRQNQRSGERICWKGKEEDLVEKGGEEAERVEGTYVERSESDIVGACSP